ncbi:MAG: hypothetical protein JWM71_97, partial [Solirubrobacteraceae bacterium]|nr:hypothetical protein [Solirubrobacteraceae bacterium]
MRVSRRQWIMGHAALVLAALVALVPLVGVVLMALGSPADVGGKVSL